MRLIVSQEIDGSNPFRVAGQLWVAPMWLMTEYYVKQHHGSTRVAPETNPPSRP
jgi:hypothetical protein